ncbi:DUF4307 domain-containing protein [Kocuria tytonicola]|uniref:DUF4307 domain-containing protein n=1 Tax=Kocuria tytonicola TaxID=2055946 RepID=A0A3L9L0S3_9MICC|nr:DUF4307 domain-containing protein [Kocuria tytonicola]RLY92235.1 DUF4307 domain-containing protein [Kocuria tytonicola]
MSSATSHPAADDPAGSGAPEVLVRRYGAGHHTVTRTPRQGPSQRGWLLIAAGATLAAALFVVWIVWGDSQKPVFKDVSFHISSSGQAYADFDLTKDPDQTVTCAVQALNQEHAVVGWNEITIGRVAEAELRGRTSTHRVPVRTTNLATTAGVDSCWSTSE